MRYVLAVLLLVCLAAPGLPQAAVKAELMVWVKADDLTELCKDGERVSLWPDAGGGKRDLKANGDGRPTFKLAGAAGHATVVFAGDVQKKINECFSLPLTGEWRGMTFFVLGKNIGAGGLLDTAPGRNGCLRTMGWLQLCGTPAALPHTFPAATGNTDLALGTISEGIDAAGNLSLTTYVNGKQQDTMNTAAPLYGTIFADSHIGNNNNGENCFNGEIAELLIYRGMLSEADRTRVERYLLAKYRLAAATPDDPTLPVGYTPPQPPAQLPPPPPVKSRPAQTGLLVWSRADALSALRDGALLSSWPNAAGEQQPLSSEIGHRPRFVARALNNRPVIHFAGDGAANPKIFHCCSLPVHGQFPAMTLVVAGRNLGSAGVFDSAPGQNGCLRTEGWLQLCGSKLAPGDPFPLFAYQPGAQMITLLVGRLGEKGQFLETYANGHLQVRAETPDALTPVLFANPTLGTNNLGETQFNGDMAEVLLYDHALTEAERKQTEAYLAEKYAIPIKSDEQLAKEKNARSRYTLTMPQLPRGMSWFGNTFSGKTEWVQSGISGIAALPDGTLAATSVWDEPHKEIGFYQDGKPVGPKISGGCSMITCADRYLYVGNSGMGKPTAGVRRYTRDGQEAPWAELKEAKWIAFATGGAWNEVCGLAVRGGELFVTTQERKEILVYDAATAACKRALPLPHPGPFVLDKDGAIWLGDAHGVMQLAADGTPTGKAITGVSVGALAVDAAGHLLVADNGERQQVIRYDLSGAQPAEIGAIGVRGGVYASPRRGALLDSCLWNPSAVSADGAGNVYVNGGGLLRSYTPAGALRWQLQCTVFCTCADFDPATDGADIYDGRYHYRYQPDQPAGRDWKIVGVTADTLRFPELAEGQGQNVLLRRLSNGQLYRYSWGESIVVHRLEPGSETFVPCAMYYAQEQRNSYRPQGVPATGRFVWSDRNGDGLLQPQECVPAPAGCPPSHESFSFYVDDRGGIWEPEDRWGVRYLPLRGFTAAGAPSYDLAHELWYPRPPEFTQVLRAIYFPASDTMYLAGYTWDCPITGHEYGWGQCGHELIRYDNWTKPTRSVHCRMPFPEQAQDIKALTIAEHAHRAFAGEMEGNVLFTYDTDSGKFLGVIEPDPALVGGVGWLDIDSGVRAYTRKNGEVLLLNEDSWAQKQMVYRVPRQ